MNFKGRLGRLIHHFDSVALGSLSAFLTALLTIFLTPQLLVASSKDQEFRVELPHQVVFLNLPEGWEAKTNFMGMDLVLHAQQVDNMRAVVGLNSFSQSKQKVNPQDFKRSHGDYVQGQKSSLEGSQSVFKEALPYQKKSWPHLPEVHVFGIKYERVNTLFREEHRYFLCGGHMVELSLLSPEAQMPKVSEEIDQVLKSFRCTPR